MFSAWPCHILCRLSKQDYRGYSEAWDNAISRGLSAQPRCDPIYVPRITVAAFKRLRIFSKLPRYNELAQVGQIINVEYLSNCLAYPGDLEGGGGGIIMDDGSTVSGARFDTLRSSSMVKLEDIFSNRTDLAVKAVAATKPSNTSFLSLYVKLVSEEFQLLRDNCEDELSRLKLDAQTALSLQAAVLDQANAAAGVAGRAPLAKTPVARAAKDTTGAKGNQRQRANAKKAEAEAENAALRAQLAESRHAVPASPHTPGVSTGGAEDHSPPAGGARVTKPPPTKAAAEVDAKKKAAAAAAAAGAGKAK